MGITSDEDANISRLGESPQPTTADLKPTVHTNQNALLARMRSYNSYLDRLMRTQFYTSTTLEQFLQESTETISKLLHVKRVGIWNYTAQQDGIFCHSLLKDNEFIDQPSAVFQKQDFPRYFQAISQCRVISAHTARTDQRTSEFTQSYLIPFNVYSMIDAHIPSAAGVRGVLCCEHVGAVRYWTLDEASFIASVAELIGLAFDRAERTKTQQQLADALHAAEQAAEAKSTFLATMSHEIRTPLNGVLGMLEVALSKETNPAQSERLNIAYKSARSLHDILGDVLDFTRLEAGELSLEDEPYSIIDLLADIANLYRPLAEAKNLSIDTCVDKTTPLHISGDATKVRQIITNLLSNALKFTSRGQVTISAQMEQQPPIPHLRIAVTDTGIGIPCSALSTLFQRFSQVDSSTTRDYGGSGLGLAICKQMVELMGGEIGVNSNVDSGSEFWFRIPVTEVSEQAKTATDSPQNNHGSHDSSTKLNILAAEDNVVNQKVLSAMVASIGHDITVVANGLDALEALSNHPYDAVLMDIQMPIMDGIAATQAIRELPAPTRDITIIALTANVLAGDREQYLSAGMNDYIAKPLTRSRLQHTLNQVAKNKSAQPGSN